MQGWPCSNWCKTRDVYERRYILFFNASITTAPPSTLALACLLDFITVYLHVSAICGSLCLSSDIGIMLHKCKLAEILRQELNESDDERNDSFSVDNDSSECEDIVEVNDDVPDKLDEAGVLAVQLSLHQFATWWETWMHRVANCCSCSETVAFLVAVLFSRLSYWFIYCRL